jgi:hypothetical protein
LLLEVWRRRLDELPCLLAGWGPAVPRRGRLVRRQDDLVAGQSDGYELRPVDHQQAQVHPALSFETREREGRLDVDERDDVDEV